MRHADVNPPGIVRPAVSLEEELAKKIKDREKSMIGNIMEYARSQGEDLRRVKQHLGNRKFNPWLKENCGFSRKTAYQYIDVVDNWQAICHLGLQMQSLRQALSILFGSGKAKKQPDSASATEADSGKSRRGKKPSTKCRSGKNMSAASDSDHVENHDTDHDQSTPAPEQKEQRDEKSHERDGTEKKDKSSKNSRKTSHQNHSPEKSDGETDNPTFPYVFQFKDLRVYQYLHELINDVLDRYRQFGFANSISPEYLREAVQQEDPQTRLILEVMFFRLDIVKMREKWRETDSQSSK